MPRLGRYPIRPYGRAWPEGNSQSTFSTQVAGHDNPVPYPPHVPDTSSESHHAAGLTAPARRRAGKGRRHSWLRETIIMVVVALIVAFTVRTFIASSFWIPSGSMENTLLIGDHVIVYKLGYDFHDPRRGDIVVFKAPPSWAEESGDGGDWIKRVIAVGGDTVAFRPKTDKLYVNGKALNEPYIYRDPVTGQQDPPSEHAFSVTVPKDRLWLMGDHRSNSSDSREHYLQGYSLKASTIPDSSVVGRAFAIYWPLDRIGWLSDPSTFSQIPDAKNN